MANTRVILKGCSVLSTQGHLNFRTRKILYKPEFLHSRPPREHLTAAKGTFIGYIKPTRNLAFFPERTKPGSIHSKKQKKKIWKNSDKGSKKS